MSVSNAELVEGIRLCRQLREEYESLQRVKDGHAERMSQLLDVLPAKVLSDLMLDLERRVDQLTAHAHRPEYVPPMTAGAQAVLTGWAHERNKQ